METFKNNRVVISAETIQKRIVEIGKSITADYQGTELILIGVLKGSLYFLSDLTRQIDLPLKLDFITISTIPDTTRKTGIVRITKDIDVDITGRHVLLIEDIIRTGLTTAYLIQTLKPRLPASLKVCSLLVNPEQQMINVPIAYSGFEISKTRLIGYGMDIEDFGRNLSYIAEVGK